MLPKLLIAICQTPANANKMPTTAQCRPFFSALDPCTVISDSSPSSCFLCIVTWPQFQWRPSYVLLLQVLFLLCLLPCQNTSSLSRLAQLAAAPKLLMTVSVLYNISLHYSLLPCLSLMLLSPLSPICTFALLSRPPLCYELSPQPCFINLVSSQYTRFEAAPFTEMDVGLHTALQPLPFEATKHFSSTSLLYYSDSYASICSRHSQF